MEPARAEPTTRTSHSTVSTQSSTVSAGGSPSQSSGFAAAAYVADNLALDVDARSYLFDFARENGIYLAR